MVTEMDMRSERTIVEMLRVAFPDHGVVAEETKLSNASGYTDHRPFLKLWPDIP
jgi:fructose-1,6-bisphosphatase/inositol monophosphatase family enzyme